MASADGLHVAIKTPDGAVPDVYVEWHPDWTVAELKETICREYPTHPNPENQRLIYSGRLLTDDRRLGVTFVC